MSGYNQQSLFDDVQVDVQRGRWPAARVSEHAAGDGEAAGLAGEKEVGGQLRRRQGGAQDSQDQPGTVSSNLDIDVKQRCYTII